MFLAPGASHCGSGTGPAPSDPVTALAAWVEHGKAPRSIPAVLSDPTTGKTVSSRPLCAYPDVAVYSGHGSTDDAKNFACRRQTRSQGES
jgi:feruloyl esterase